MTHARNFRERSAGNVRRCILAGGPGQQSILVAVNRQSRRDDPPQTLAPVAIEGDGEVLAAGAGGIESAPRLGQRLGADEVLVEPKSRSGVGAGDA